MNEEERRRVGAYVRTQRMHKFGTVDAARIAARISRGAWDAVEQGKEVRDFTYGKVEKALDLPPGWLGSVAAIGIPEMGVYINSDDPAAQTVDVPGRGRTYRLLLLDADGVPVAPSDQEAYAAAVRALLETQSEDLVSLLAVAGREYVAKPARHSEPRIDPRDQREMEERLRRRDQAAARRQRAKEGPVPKAGDAHEAESGT